MPSLEHELPLKLLQGAPSILRALVQRFLPHVPIGADTPVVKQGTDFTEIVPSSYRSDGVYTLGDPIIHAVVIEVQRRIDLRKPYAWIRYLAGLFAEHQVPVDVVVITSDPAVARWARQKIQVSSGTSWSPVVIDPSMLLVDNEVDLLLEHPALAVLWIQLAKGRYDVPAEVFIKTSQWLAEEAELAEDTRKLYRDVIRYAAPAAILDLMRAHMDIAEQKYETEFFRSFYRDAHREGLEEGREEGVGIGELRATRQSLQAVIEARGFVIDADHRERLESCNDIEQLNRWIWQAATADSIEEALS